MTDASRSYFINHTLTLSNVYFVEYDTRPMYDLRNKTLCIASSGCVV